MVRFLRLSAKKPCQRVNHPRYRDTGVQAVMQCRGRCSGPGPKVNMPSRNSRRKTGVGGLGFMRLFAKSALNAWFETAQGALTGPFGLGGGPWGRSFAGVGSGGCPSSSPEQRAPVRARNCSASQQDQACSERTGAKAISAMLESLLLSSDGMSDRRTMRPRKGRGLNFV